MADLIEDLAEYFTGPAVAHNSISLGMPAPHNIMAKKFFDMRQRLGINYYMPKEEAVIAIRSRLAASSELG